MRTYKGQVSIWHTHPFYTTFIITYSYYKGHLGKVMESLS